MTDLVRISASQVKTFLECPRKWSWERVAGFESPESVGTELGTRVHALLEHYLRDGTPPSYAETWSFHPPWEHDPPTPDHAKQLDRSRKRDGTPRVYYPGRIALTMLGPHLPKPGTGTVEGYFEWADTRIPGTVWTGYKDVSWRDQRQQVPTANVLDHKTSSDPEVYGLTDQTLPHDPQYLIYAEHEIQVPGLGEPCDQVRGVWHYGARDASQRKARVVEIIERAEDITRKYEQKIVPVGKLLRKHRAAGTNPLDLPANPDTCGNYGGCPHIGRCQLSDDERTGAIARAMSDTNEDFDLDALLVEAEETPEPSETIEDVDDALAALGLEDEQPSVHENDRVNPPEARKPASKAKAKLQDAIDNNEAPLAAIALDATYTFTHAQIVELGNVIGDRLVSRIAAALAAAAGK